MSLPFPPVGALAGIEELSALVESLRGLPLSTQEDDWIEWKSQADLSKREWHFEIARQVLALANRDPETAVGIAGGYGYLLVGVQPGELSGVLPIDISDLESAVLPFLGTDGPRWRAQYVENDGAAVLVVVVPPPRDGDPLHCLRKGSSTARPGAIYIRRRGSTVQPDPAELAMLVRRAAPREPGLAVGATVGPSCLHGFAWDAAQVESVVQLEIAELRAPREAVEPWGVSAVLNPSPRSHNDDVAEYAQRLRPLVPQLLTERALNSGHCRLEIRIQNQDDRFLEQIAVQLEISKHYRVVTEPEGEIPEMLLRPPRWQDRGSFALVPRGWDSPALFPSGPELEENETYTLVRFPTLNLQATDSKRLDCLWLVPRDGELGTEVAWRATAKNRRGVMEGRLSLAARFCDMDATDIWRRDTKGN